MFATSYRGISVVLDFPGNTKTQRSWFRELIERANVEHELYFVDASDALCKSQLRDRSQGLPAGHCLEQGCGLGSHHCVQPPTAHERFNVIRHDRSLSLRQGHQPTLTHPFTAKLLTGN
jgi:hypothetical protein